MSSPPLAVEAHGLTKRFGDFTAVDHVDLEAPAGSVVALLGPNGAGKTTTVRMLATLSEPNGGSARVCGFDIATQPDEVRRVISLTGQFAALEDNLTASENLILMARLRGYGNGAAKKLAGGLIDRFDIGEFRGKLVKSLSGGQRRRVDLACSLVIKPELLVLDEPTTGLDPRSRQVVWATVRDLVADGVSLLLTTQYLDEADALAESIVFIDHGRVVATGTPSQLRSRIGDHRVDVIATDNAGFEQLTAHLGARFDVTTSAERRMVSVPAPRQSVDLGVVNDAVLASGIAVDEVALRKPTLDDAFLALTGSTPTTDTSAEEALV